MTEVDSILEIKNLRKVFNTDLFKKSHVAVDNLSCRFRRNRCTGLLGHNGAGKTTAIRLIFGLLRPTSGQILFNGKAVNTEAKKKLGYMPEVNKLPDTLTPAELLHYHLAAYKPELNRSEKKDLIENALNQVKLWDSRGKKVKSLSKGMARRLAWAMATIHDPEFVVLDEPFSGLDPLARQDLLSWIRGFKSAGKSLLLCTHELWSVQALCDEVHIFRKGKLAYSTLDKAEEQHASGLTRSNYNLDISGIKLENLQALKSRFSLPDWKSIHQSGFLVKLTFFDYESAAKWLKTCIDDGLIVVRFTDELSIDDEELRSIFEGGQIQ